MVAHADADVDGNDMQSNEEDKHLPAKEEQGRYCAHVKDEHEAEDGPVECSRLCGAAESEWLMPLYFRMGCCLRLGRAYPAADGVNSRCLVGE